MNRIMTLCTSILLSCVMGVSVFAQGGYEVKGVVVDAVGPVIGATVIEQGTANGTSTSLDGDYVLTVSNANAIVEISCIGYASQTFTASQVPSTVTLTEDTQFLDEVVVIGYGTVKKEDMTGSITAIKADEINRGAVVNTQDLLKGKVAGLLVTPGDGGPGSGSRIRVRGAASLNASNDPLIVIDGVPIAQGAGAGMSNPLDLINANDIESFSVMKDASSAAIYGSRASNGVIIITTKKGKGNKPSVSYSGSVSVQQNSARVPTMTGEELRAFYSEAYPAGTINGDNIAALYGDGNYDYQSMIFRPGVSHDRNISIHGNVNERMPYRASLGWIGQTGTLVGSNYDRGTLDLNLSPNFLDKHLTFDLNAKGVYTVSDFTDSGVIGNAAFFNPTQDPYWRNEDGTIDYTTTNGFWNYGNGRGEGFSPNTLVGEAPLSQLYDKFSNQKATRFIGRAAVDYKVHGFEALRFNLSVSLDYTVSNKKDGSRPGSIYAWKDTENKGIGQYSKSYNMTRSKVLEAYANYNETWGIHNLDVMAGYSWQNNYWADRSVSYFNETDEVKLDHTKGETEYSRYLWWKNENYMVSFYGRVNYSIDSRYIFTASVRYDGSSKFSKATRWGFFPSGAFAWNIKQEGFLKDSKAVSALKLRLSAGVTGQQDGIDNYIHLAEYSTSTDVYHMYPMGNVPGGDGTGFVHWMTPGAYDPNIKWETTTTYNAALDFGFFNDRLSGTIDVYRRDTKDLLNNVVTPMGSNFGNSVMTNVGSLRNQGVEFTINAIPVQTKDWSVQVGFNGTFQSTKFTKLNANSDPTYFVECNGKPTKGTGGSLSRQMVGYEPFTYYCYQQLYDADGNPIQNAFVDRDEDGVISEGDLYMTGKSINPDFFYGINFKVSYKNWDFGFNGHGSVGGWAFNDFNSSNSTSNVDVNAGNLPNLSYIVNKTKFTKANSKEQWYSDYFLESTSFFRLDDVNFGYTFKNVGIQENLNIRLAICAQNLFVISKYSGMDPEVSAENGIDGTIWPRPRTYAVRLNINF